MLDVRLMATGSFAVSEVGSSRGLGEKNGKILMMKISGFKAEVFGCHGSMQAWISSGWAMPG